MGPLRRYSDIMRPIQFSSQRLEALFQDTTVATLPQLKAALGTAVDLTVFRKLSALPYRTSYSHRGAYYTLDPLAHYDELGLWSYRDIYFSRHGTLLDTAATLVTKAPAGYFTDELEAVVQVAAKDALRQLAQQGRLYRREWEGRYLYCASQRGRRQQQWAARQAQQHPEDEEQAAMVLFYSLLDEQQRRLYAGLESLEWGHGGDQRMAQLFGLDADTVARGRRELLSGQVLSERVRRAGGGRPRVEKNAGPLEPTAGVAAPRYGRGSDGTAGSLDRPAPGANQPAVEAFGPFGLSQHRAAFTRSDGLRAACQSQESLRPAKPGA